MSRTFLNNTNRVTTGYTANPGATMSYFIWTRRIGEGGSSLGRMWQKGASVTALFNTSPNYIIGMDFTTTDGNWSFTRPSQDVWHSIGFTYDSANSAPIVYVDGVSVSVTTTTAPVGTITGDSTAHVIGNSSAGNRAWQGQLAWHTVWNAILSANEMLALGRGTIPWRVRPASIVACLPVWGLASPEPDLVRANGSATITGTPAWASDPPMTPMYFAKAAGPCRGVR